VNIKGNDKLYREALLEALADPEEAANYLAVALDDSWEAFRNAYLNVVDALHGGKAGPSRAEPRLG
jgi:DNA-binding phage protein